MWRSFFCSLFILSLLSITSCKKDKFEGSFEVNFFQDIEIPAGLANIGAHYIVVEEVRPQMADLISGLGYNINDVVDIDPKFIRLDAISPVNISYNFIFKISLLIETEDLPRIELGYFDFLPNNTTNFIDLIPSITEGDTDVTEHLKSNQVKLYLRLELNTPPPSFVTTRMNLTFAAYTE